MTNFIVVWQSNRCSICDSQEDAIETVKNLMQDGIDLGDIQIFKSSEPTKVTISIDC